VAGGGAPADGAGGGGAWGFARDGGAGLRDSGDDGSGVGTAVPEVRGGHGAVGGGGSAGAQGEHAAAARSGSAPRGGGGGATCAPGTRHAADPGRNGALRGPGRVGDDGATDPARRGATGDSTRTGAQARSTRASIRASGAESTLAIGHLHVFAATASPSLRDRLHGRLLAVRGLAGGGAPSALVPGAGSAGAGDRGVRSAQRGAHGPGTAVRVVARAHRLRGGAAAARHPAHQEPPAPSADAGQDRALLEDAVGGVSLPDGLCGFRGRPAAHRPLRPGLQLPAAAPGDRGGGAGGPFLPRRAPGEGRHREGSGAQRAGPGPGAAAEKALLPGRSLRGA